MSMYDIGGASAGQASQLQPEERQFQRLNRMVKVAEQTNYDGDPEYYNQIKAIAMQAGIPIKQFKSNPFRAMGIGAMSMLDTALLGLIPNSVYTPEGGHVSAIDEAADAAGMMAGMVLPWGAPARLAGGALKMGGRALASGMAPGATSARNFIKGSPRLMKAMGIQPKGTKAAQQAARDFNPVALDDTPLLGTGQPLLPMSTVGGGAGRAANYVPKKSVSVPKADSYVGGGTKASQVAKKAQTVSQKKPGTQTKLDLKSPKSNISKKKVKSMTPKAIALEIKKLTGKMPKIDGKTRGQLEAQLLKARAEANVKLAQQAKKQYEAATGTKLG